MRQACVWSLQPQGMHLLQHSFRLAPGACWRERMLTVRYAHPAVARLVVAGTEVSHCTQAFVCSQATLHKSPVCILSRASCIRTNVSCMLQNVIEVDFAALHKEDPSLLTLKDFVMASNQAPNNPDDILSLLQAFAEFQQSQGASCLACHSPAWHGSLLPCTQKHSVLHSRSACKAPQHHCKQCPASNRDRRTMSSAQPALSPSSCLICSSKPTCALSTSAQMHASAAACAISHYQVQSSPPLRNSRNTLMLYYSCQK